MRLILPHSPKMLRIRVRISLKLVINKTEWFIKHLGISLMQKNPVNFIQFQSCMKIYLALIFFSLQTLTPSKDKLPRQLSLCIDVKNLEDFLSAQLILKTSFDLIYSISFFYLINLTKSYYVLLDNNMKIRRDNF